MTETQVLLEICEYLQAQGFFFWRSNNVPAAGRKFGSFRTLPKFTPKGLPDIMIVRKGRFIGLEVKKPEGTGNERERNGRRVRGGKLSPEQAEWGTKLVLEGGEYAKVSSLEEAKKFIFAYRPPRIGI